MRAEKTFDISQFVDNSLADVYLAFAQEAFDKKLYTTIQSSRNHLNLLRSDLESMKNEDITWSFFCQLLAEKRNLDSIWFHFFQFSVEKGLYQGEYSDYLKRNSNMFKVLSSGKGRIRESFKMYSDDLTPFSFIMNTVNRKTQTAVVPHAGEGIHNILKGFLEERELSTNAYYYIFINIVFNDYSGQFECMNAFNDSTFEKHYHKLINNYVPKNSKNPHRCERSVVGALVDFYYYIQQNLPDEIRERNFKIYTPVILKYLNLQRCLKDGYKIVPYNLYVAPPEGSRFLLNPQTMDYVRGAAIIDKPVMLDVSNVTNKKIQRWVIECFWYDTQHVLSNRTKKYTHVIKFASLLCWKYNEYDENIFITAEDIIKFKREILKETKNDNIVLESCIMVRFFLNYLESRKYMTFDGIIYALLVHKESASGSYKEAYTADEINLLSRTYSSFADDNSDTRYGILYKLQYYIFQILSTSEIRISNLLELRQDSIVSTLNSKGKHDYALRIYSKNSGDDFTLYNITAYTRALLTEVIALTEDIRAEAIGKEAEYIFIYKRINKKISLMRSDTVRDHLQKMCKIAGVRILTTAAIRNFYCQKASERITKNGYDPIMVEKVTGHTHSTQIRSYDNIDIKEFCQIYHNIVIGNLQISGRIEGENSLPESQTVMNGCGHCAQTACQLTGYLDCLMCANFVTTPDNIPFFENEIQKLDDMIKKERIPHERDFLVSKKKLYVAYLVGLMEVCQLEK